MILRESDDGFPELVRDGLQDSAVCGEDIFSRCRHRARLLGGLHASLVVRQVGEIRGVGGEGGLDVEV